MQKSESNLNTPKYEIRPASPDEAGLFFGMPPEKDAELGCIGHVRMDFGRSGTEFWHTWHPRGPEELNSQAFKDELTEVVDEMRQSVLKNFSAMTGYCRGHGGEIKGGWVTQNYGYIVETERYRYCLRCNPIPGDYNGYLTAFDLNVQRQNMAQKNKPLVGRGGLMLVPIVQSITGQLQKNYGKEGSEIIVDNCQVNIFGGFAPGSQTADMLSESLGNRTVLSGTVSRGKENPSQSLQMMARPLMTPDELKSMPKGSFIVAKTGVHPMQVRLRLFLDWGIRFEQPYEVPEKV